MNEAQDKPSQSTTDSVWTSTQAYVLAVFCLLLGVGLGYLFRGSAPSTAQAAVTGTSDQAADPQQGSDPRHEPSAEMQAALAKAATPLLEAVNKNPKDYESLIQLGNVFYDGRQFPNAIQYYDRALAIHPENPDVRTDM